MRPDLPSRRVAAPLLARLALLLAGLTGGAAAQTVLPPFDADYTAANLGAVPGLPQPYGGMTFLRGQPDVLLIGGRADQVLGKIYQVTVARDASGHITGFLGTATEFAEAPYIDGGLAYGPGNVLFYSRFPENEVGQILPGSSVTDKVIDLTTIGIMDSPGGLQFVAAGFAAAGSLKICDYSGQIWYTTTPLPDGAGTFDLTPAVAGVSLSNTVEGMVYATAGSPQLTDYGSVLVAEYRLGQVSVFDVDAGGDAIVASRRPLVSGTSRALGLALDPVSGDLLVSSFSGARCYVVRGFGRPCQRPASWSNYGAGWPGTLGVPHLLCSAPPVIGTQFDVLAGNSSGRNDVGLLLAGLASASLPMRSGGEILVSPWLFVPIPVQWPETRLRATLPFDPTLCAFPLFVQTVQNDPGAAGGLSFSAGLSLLLGE